MIRALAYLLGVVLVLSSVYVAQKPGAVLYIPPAQTTNAASVELMGYAWSENIGWISMNCANTGTCGTSGYKVILDTVTNNLNGYAWSENVGWIQFGGLSGCPQGTCDARKVGSELRGWARMVNGDGIASPTLVQGTSTFSATGTQSFVVPTGVTSIAAKLWGAGGGAQSGGTGGGGGFANGTSIGVTPGETLAVDVGAGGGSSGTNGGNSVVRRSSTHLARGGGGDGGNGSQGSGGTGYISAGGSTESGSGAVPGGTADASYISGIGVGATSSGDSAWDISNGSYVGKKDVGPQDGNPYGVAFKDDGTRMFMVGGGGRVYQYQLSTAWDITTASYSISYTVSSQDGSPRGVFFSTDGTRMYVTGSGGDEVNEYSLSSPWSIATVSYVQTLSISAQSSNPDGIFFKSDGTKMFIADHSDKRVNEYSLSTAWNISTASHVRYFTTTPQGDAPIGVSFKSDGTKMYVSDKKAKSVNEYSLSIAWNISSASYVDSFSASAQASDVEGMYLKQDDGLKFYIAAESDDEINEYSLSGSGIGTAGANGYAGITYTQSFPAATNGADGWISLNCANTGTCGTSNYGAQVGASEFTGYAWGSEVLGWISMNCLDQGTCATSNYRVYFNTPCSVGYACTADNSASVYTDPWCSVATTTCNAEEMCRADMGSICGPGNPSGQLVFTSQRVRKGNTTQISWPALAAYDSCRVNGTATGGATDSWNWSSSTPLANVTTSAIQNEVTYTLECTQIGDVSATYVLLDTERVTLLPAIKEI